jgi:hypothetical protein
MNTFMKRAILMILLFVFLGISTYRVLLVVRAEQAGSSPESGASSRLATAATAVEELGYGSEAEGEWGDWGAMWNRIYSSAQAPFNDAITYGVKNGGNGDYSQGVGGVDDYNSNGTAPSDSFSSTWEACNVGNDYCGLGGTGGNIAEKMDTSTGIVWSSQISAGLTWFGANNCKYPNGLPGDDGQCNVHGEVACQCVKLESNKTGCEAQTANSGNWRLPTQKELMISYINGSRANLANPNVDYISSTTVGHSTTTVYRMPLSTGYTYTGHKLTGTPVRCVQIVN